MPPRRIVLILATVLWLTVIAGMTLTPSPAPDGESLVRRVIAWIGSTPMTAWFTWDVAEFTANVLMFVPLGALLTALMGRERWWTVGLIALGLSCAIEAAQGLWLPTRVPDVRDLVSNGSGGFIGALLTVVLTRARTPTERTLRHAR